MRYSQCPIHYSTILPYPCLLVCTHLIHPNHLFLFLSLNLHLILKALLQYIPCSLFILLAVRTNLILLFFHILFLLPLISTIQFMLEVSHHMHIPDRHDFFFFYPRWSPWSSKQLFKFCIHICPVLFVCLIANCRTIMWPSYFWWTNLLDKFLIQFLS